MTISEVLTAFGAYYLNAGQNKRHIYSQLTQGFVTGKAFTQISTDDTIWRASEAQHSEVLQGFQIAFTPKGSSTFKPVEIRQFHMKADLAEHPDSIEESWLGFLASNNVSRKEWPFVRYWMENMVVPRIQSDMELKAIGSGVYGAPVANTANAASAAMDGILTIIDKHITDGKITPITLGAIPTTSDKDVVNYFESFHKQLPKLYWSVPMTIYAPQDVVLRYKRGFGEKYGLYNNFTENADGTTQVKFTNLNIVGLPSLNFKADGSPNDRFFCTPKSNAIMLTKRLGNSAGIFNIQAQDRQVKLLTDWWMGVGFVIPEIVFVNDGAAVTPPEEEEEED